MFESRTEDTAVIAARIRDMDPDVLAVQELEDIDILLDFHPTEPHRNKSNRDVSMATRRRSECVS